MLCWMRHKRELARSENYDEPSVSDNGDYEDWAQLSADLR
jgi:hypothetical protein